MKKYLYLISLLLLVLCAGCSNSSFNPDNYSIDTNDSFAPLKTTLTSSEGQEALDKALANFKALSEFHIEGSYISNFSGISFIYTMDYKNNESIFSVKKTEDGYITNTTYVIKDNTYYDGLENHDFAYDANDVHHVLNICFVGNEWGTITENTVRDTCSVGMYYCGISSTKDTIIQINNDYQVSRLVIHQNCLKYLVVEGVNSSQSILVTSKATMNNPYQN